ncbi:choice-of-anchor J domain-containing protein [Flavobacterium tibetense]|jgi:hypothetical protein|uniref:Uncharacterized protein n=1 Tax=Flavobacterium tibetense TaxID=2233533 RepID=A0A365P339_9FLAO|nr:choice-of-anchor J domain-containing protein [Flavobacterium tibetense]RBA28958.1 hypothetical protein DPN68_04125 [Flavobacterium tibetense]
MKNNILKIVFLLALSSSVLTSCVKEDDFDIPPIKQLILSEGFETSTTGSGSTEVPISIEGWLNFNTTSTRLWHARIFSSNKYAEFSSFFSANGTNDEAWLITPALDLTTTESELFSFDTKIRFWQGAALTVFISEDYDGTQAGLTTATWTELNPILPVSGQEDVFLNSGNIDLSAYNSENVRIAFKYTGSRAGVTTTYQLDNIKVFEN